MEADQLIQAIKAIREDIDSLHLYFIERTFDENKEVGYICHKPEIALTITQEISDLTLGCIERVLAGMQFIDFDPTCYEDSTIETLNVSQVANLNKMQECVKNIPDSNPFDFNEVESDKLWAYCMVIKNKSGNEVMLFKKFSAAKVMKNKIPLFSNGRTLNKLENRIFTIDERMDAFVYLDKLYVLNRFYFESIFNYNDAYQNVLKAGIDKVEGIGIINGFEEFKSACLESNKIAKQFTKIMSSGGLERYQRNLPNIPKVIEEYQINVKFVDDKLVYEDKTSLPDIIKLFSNLFAKTALDDIPSEAIKLKPRK